MNQSNSSLKLIQLNFPENYQIRLKETEGKWFIFCLIRKKWLSYTPEEWVRQHILHFLIHEKKFSTSNIKLEHIVEINGMKKRSDITIFRQEHPFLMVECKAPHISITQQTFDQIARYNMQIGANYLMVSNGLNHYYCQIDYALQRYQFLLDLPQNQ